MIAGRSAPMLLVSLVAWLSASPAHAGLSKAALDEVRVDQHVGEILPPQSVVTDIDSGPTTLGKELGGQPALAVFDDYTCQTSCGVALEALLHRLSGFSPRDYRIVVMSLDPKDGVKEARDFAQEHVTVPAQRASVRFTTEDEATTHSLTDTAGLRYTYDAEHDQFAHPTVALLLDAKGTIRRYLDPFQAQPLDMRLALTEAQGDKASIVNRIFLTCYAWNAATGTYTPLIGRILMAFCFLTVGLLAGGILFLLRLERRRTARQELLS
ncbi:protein SCO1/2 [Faunimonas pinastri]|uniref:Protein SCO1/2 n=1 Tax=Faunimonas pinastri TaxID=1855383 RepID=A0A1H9LVD5_9HYPH|nr:hypothetical protein [Faunimonas pinastri]SER14803.1 protein SCO1/2 [Faunimonas pinastri]